MPQGDLVFFPYDVTVVLFSYLAGYFLFVSLFAPRIVATFRARAKLNSPSHDHKLHDKLDQTSRKEVFKSLELLSGLSIYSVGASEFLLQSVQFVLLLSFLYYLAVNSLHKPHFEVAIANKNIKSRPTFNQTLAVTNNLLILWNQNRTTLFYQPATHALFEATHATLQILQRGVPLSVLPRLLSVVRASKGLNAV